MFLRTKESFRLSINSIRRCIGFSNSRDFHLTHCAYLRSVSAGRRKVVEVRDNERNQSVAGEFSVSVPPKNVNDNFFGIESDEGVIQVTSTASLKNNATRQLFRNVEQEKIITTSFGAVRYDSENKPKLHGQLEKEQVLVSSNIDKDKIRELNEALLKINSSTNHKELSDTKKSSKSNIDKFDKNLNHSATSSSYVDELYFPESYNREDTFSKSENSLSSSIKEKPNVIEEYYFEDKIPSAPDIKDNSITSANTYSADKNCHFPDQETSSNRIADYELPGFQSMSELKNSPSSVNEKNNFIEESYFNDKMVNEAIFENVNTTPENIGNPPSSVNEKYNFIEESYFNDKTVNEAIFENVNTTPESIGSSNKNKPSLVSKKPTEYNAVGKQSSFSSKGTKLSSENLCKTQETETNLKTLYDLNESIEKINEDDNDDQLSLKLNIPNLEELEVSDKFSSSSTDLLKKKNNFLFQSKEFLKKSELLNSKKSSKVKGIRSVQRSLDKNDTAEEARNEAEVKPTSQKTLNSQVHKEAGDKNSNANEQPETAYDYVKKLRSEKKKLGPELKNGKFIQKTELYDSKGFRILKNQVPDLSYYTRDEILKLLSENVLYSDEDLIVLNKPYNLVIHESKTTKDPCLSQYLDDLAAELDKTTNKPKLITVHRLDKETSGCLLLARNEVSAQKLLSLFSQRKIVKTYWIVTTRVPDPLEGIIDMPISEGSVDGRARMVLHPDLPKDIPYHNNSKGGKRAVTHYKVIAESGNAALVEVNPETGVKHQIRVHFGFGLSCPILGDHKYSHLDKLAPQKLQADLLQRLHVRQSKVRYIPMHIYARSILIPQYKDGRNLFVMAPMPVHMSKNLQRLKFRKK